MVGARFIARMRNVSAIFGEGGRRLRSELRQTRIGRSLFVRLTYRVIMEMGSDDSTHMAASVSYYAILSLFPLVIALTAMIGWFVDSLARQEELISFIADNLPGSERFVRDSIEGSGRFRGVLGILSVFGLMWAGSAVFGSITRVVNRAWDISGNLPFYKNKPRQLAMSLGVGVLFLISVGLTGLVQWSTSIEIGGRSVNDILSGPGTVILLGLPAFLITVAIFMGIYKYLPNTKTYWRYLWPGAVLAAVLFELAKSLFVWYVGMYASYDQLYGSVASVIVLMVWAYICALILILGAEVASEYERLKRGAGRGQVIGTK